MLSSSISRMRPCWRASLSATWHDWSNRLSTPRGNVTPGARPRSGSSWPRRPLTGSTSHDGYRFMACAAVRCSACAGRISICTPGCSPSTRPGSWSSTGPHRRAQVPQRQADAPAQRRTSRRTDRAAQTPAGGERDRWHGLRAWGGRAGLVSGRRVRDHRCRWHSRSPGVVLRRVRAPAQAGRAAADHPARLASHDPDADGARGVPISIVSKWAGHYDSAFTQKTYVHASDEDLQRGQAALAKIHKIA